MSQYNYVVTAYESGCFKGILRVDLFGDGVSRLVAVKSRSLEIYEVDRDAVFSDVERMDEAVPEVPVLNKVGSIEMYKDVVEVDRWRPKGQDFDDILVFTRECELILLRAYLLDSDSEKVLYLGILDRVSLRRDGLRRSQLVRMMVHVEKNRIVVLAHEGCLQVVVCECFGGEDNRVVFAQPLILRLSELTITDICLASTTNERSVLGILYDSGYSGDPRLLKVIELPLDLRKWSCGTGVGLTMQSDVFKIAPLFYRSRRQKMVRGFFLFGDGFVEYRSIEEIMPSKSRNVGHHVAIPHRVVARFVSSSFCGVDSGLSSLSITDVLSLDNGSRWLFLDNLGRLFVMLVKYDQADPEKVVGIRTSLAGRYSPFSRIVELSSDLFFIASKLSDSFLLCVRSNQFHVLSSLPNIGPIRDLLFSNVSRGSGRGTSPLIAACGFGSGGALRSICDGIGLQTLYVGNEPYVGQITRIISLADDLHRVILTGTDYSACFQIAYSCEKSSGGGSGLAEGEDVLNKENSGRPGEGSGAAQPSPGKYSISFEKCGLEGLERDEETIRICTFRDACTYQVTPSGLHPIGGETEAAGGRGKWLLRDHLPRTERGRGGPASDPDYIEKFEFCEECQVASICTGTGQLLLFELGEEEVLSLACGKTKTELFELISQDQRPLSSSSEESRDLSNESEILGNSIPRTMDEICIMALHSVDNYVVLFVGTWMSGSRLSCLYYEKQERGRGASSLEFLANIETEFREYETMVTSMKVIDLKRKVETQIRRYREEEFVVVMVGTNNGYLQLQYIPKHALVRLIKKRQREDRPRGPETSCRFEHFNTWKVSNSHISEIRELDVSENLDLNRHFFVCCDQPKVFFWSNSSTKAKHGIGAWSFFNVHSSWIPLVCQVRLPPRPQLQQDPTCKKDSTMSKTCILYVTHEEQDARETWRDAPTPRDPGNSRITPGPGQTSRQCLLNLGLVDTLQRYNCRSIPLDFTPEKVCYIGDLNMYAVLGVQEQYRDKSKVFEPVLEPGVFGMMEEPTVIQSVVCLISAQDMEMHYSRALDVNSYPTCIDYVTLRACNDHDYVRSFLAVGTCKMDAREGSDLGQSPRHEGSGRVSLYAIIGGNGSYSLVESAAYETEIAPFVIKEFKKSQLLVSIENSLICLEMFLPRHAVESSLSLVETRSAFETPRVELRVRETYCTHTMIVFIKVWNEECILVGDLMRSVGLWEFDRYTGRFHEVCRDNSLSWVVEGMFLSKDMYLVSDENRNLRVLMRASAPESDEANTSLTSVAHLHVGESVTAFHRGRFNLAYPETRKSKGGQDCMEESPGRQMFDEQIAFGTSQGGIYLLFSVKDSDPRVFSQLVLMEEAVINTIKKSCSALQPSGKVQKVKGSDLRKLFIRDSDSSLFSGVVGVLGGKDHMPLRWELSHTRQGYSLDYDCSGTPRGFVSGDIMELFLELSLDLQKCVFKELHSFRDKRRLKLPEDVNQLEVFIEKLKNMH